MTAYTIYENHQPLLPKELTKKDGRSRPSRYRVCSKLKASECRTAPDATPDLTSR
jgi:hypothetical protein